MSGPSMRLVALRQFAITISVLNLLGHIILGFENSWAQLVVSVGTAYLAELLLEVIDAWRARRPRRFEGGIVNFIDFLLPAHISGVAVSMLLYSGELLLPFAFASAVAIASKALFTFPVNDSERHFLNPSNTGIALTVFLFPTIAPIMPWQFTESLSGGMSLIFAVIVICVGTFMNWRYTRRMPLILAWVVAFAFQGVVRCLINDLPLTVGLAPLTGLSFLLFTFYMVTDPGATPSNSREQIVFGAAIAVVFWLLILTHVPYGFFYSLFIVSFLRGFILRWKAMRAVVA